MSVPRFFLLSGQRGLLMCGLQHVHATLLRPLTEAMLAAVGQVMPCYLKFPGFFKVPSGVLAVTKAPGSYGMAAIVVLAAVLEIFFWKERDDREPGDFGDPLGLQGVGGYDEFWREIELNNGRAGMFAAMGIIGAEVVTGRDAQDQLATLADIVPFF
ncbi:unnamed protein product [Prorocentrum cordatum]|uniref:Chlorophyll a-b binding protein, chloroplastic n=1 Tax=Prorocentrum cordatum TaxID=2364126 RepID=A0ABN9WLB4_9DINO|nr:unnamed protein product [Polarella glacialis]